MIEHQVDWSDAHAHLLQITLTITKPAPQQTIALPVWIPGSYLVREFSQHVHELTAVQSLNQGTRTRTIRINQLNKNTWQLSTTLTTPITVRYKVYAFDASVRTAYLDASRCFFNGACVFMRVIGQESLPQQVVLITKPVPTAPRASSAWPIEGKQNWRIATSLRQTHVSQDRHHYLAENYDELVDSPFECSEHWEGTFTTRNIKHRLVVSGAASTFDRERLLKDTKKIVDAAITFWHGAHGPPVQGLLDKGYLMLLHVVENNYGGLEHMNSTALIAKRSDLPRIGDDCTSEGYVTLLGLISHEYFHAWNVKRLRPISLLKYNYDHENYTDLLWFFEGFTSYYDDLLLRRAGLIDDASYLRLLTKTINQVQQTPGRQRHSLASSSLEAWTKYYRMNENSVNTTISYYSKGSLVALCLDLSLRQQGSSLDQVMRHLWRTHMVDSKTLMAGLTEKNILEALPNKALQQMLKKWVHGTTELPLSQLLAHIGVQTVGVPVDLAQQLGVRVQQENGLKIKQVLTNTVAAQAGLAPNDEWVAIEVNNQTWRVHTLDDVALHASAEQPISIWVARDQQMYKLPLQWPKNQLRNTQVRLRIVDATKLAAWLN